MSTLRLPPELHRKIRRHAARDYPDECCGVLVGRPGGGAEPTVVEWFEAASNEREAAARARRFLIDPRAILRATRRARERGLDIVGYYHSHPDHPASPSDFDREHAWPETSYLIVSVIAGQPRESRSWRLRHDRTAFDEEAIEPPIEHSEVDSEIDSEIDGAAVGAPREETTP